MLCKKSLFMTIICCHICLIASQDFQLWKTLTGHVDRVNSVAFGNGSLLASASSDRTIRVWNAETGDLIHLLFGHSNRIWCVAFGQDNLLASGSSDNTVKVWSPETGDLLRTLRHSSPVFSVAFDSGHVLASAGATISLWDMTSGDLVRTLTGHDGYVYSVAFSVDGLLASGSHDNTVKLWNSNTGDLLRTLSGHSSSVDSVAFLVMSNLLGSGSSDGTVNVWDSASGDLMHTMHEGARVNAIAFYNASVVVYGSDDTKVRLWNMDTSEVVGSLVGHRSTVLSVAFDGESCLASGSDDFTVKLWKF